MPKIGTEWIKTHAEGGVGGSPFSFKTEITVNSAGLFRFTVPEDLKETARDNAEQAGVSFGKLDKNYFVGTKTKDEGISFLRRVAKDYINCEVTRETVILYQTRANVTYLKTEAGQIVPNGCFVSDHNSGAHNWHGRIRQEHWTGRDCTYSVGLMAHAYVKVTFKRKSGNQISWQNAGENLSTDTWLDKLNSFVNAGFTETEREHCEEIPYTEEAARFFYEAMLSICRLSDRIESFFGDREHVQKAIENRASLMLTAPVTDKT